MVLGVNTGAMPLTPWSKRATVISVFVSSVPNTLVSFKLWITTSGELLTGNGEERETPLWKAEDGEARLPIIGVTWSFNLFDLYCRFIFFRTNNSNVNIKCTQQ